jgi:hypothetical protein
LLHCCCACNALPRFLQWCLLSVELPTHLDACSQALHICCKLVFYCHCVILLSSVLQAGDADNTWACCLLKYAAASSQQSKARNSRINHRHTGTAAWVRRAYGC